MLGRYNKGGWGLSRFHNFICESIGYLGNVDNGKVMGLASYGKVNENLYKEFRKILLLSKDGFSAQFLLDIFKWMFSSNFHLKIELVKNWVSDFPVSN